jgi:TRAP-type mannitol/chloroaromatic compound transport system permease small subunit
MLHVDRTIDALNENVGFYGSFVILALLGVVTYEVIMRYGFNAPTVWAFEATTLLYGVHFMLAFGYTHKHHGHVAIDVLEVHLPRKSRAVLHIVVNLVLFLPTIGLLSIWSVIYAATSWANLEKASTSWAPPLYPFKTIMAIGFILLLLQGIARLIQDVRALRGADA